MLLDGFNEFPDRFQATFQGSSHPALEELFGGTGVYIIPELFKFIFQNTSPKNTVIAFV